MALCLQEDPLRFLWLHGKESFLQAGTYLCCFKGGGGRSISGEKVNNGDWQHCFGHHKLTSIKYLWLWDELGWGLLCSPLSACTLTLIWKLSFRSTLPCTFHSPVLTEGRNGIISHLNALIDKRLVDVLLGAFQSTCCWMEGQWPSLPAELTRDLVVLYLQLWRGRNLSTEPLCKQRTNTQLWNYDEAI